MFVLQHKEHNILGSFIGIDIISVLQWVSIYICFALQQEDIFKSEKQAFSFCILNSLTCFTRISFIINGALGNC